MSYVIEENIPIPEPRRNKVGSPRCARTAWTMVLDQLSPGQSTLTETWEDFKAAQNFATRRPDRQFVIRKLPRLGWRVWRIN